MISGSVEPWCATSSMLASGQPKTSNARAKPFLVLVDSPNKRTIYNAQTLHCLIDQNACTKSSALHVRTDVEGYQQLVLELLRRRAHGLNHGSPRGMLSL